MKVLPRTSLNIEHLKREATALKRRHGEGDTAICTELRHFEFSFANRSDAEILEASFALNDAQRIIARQYGFASWQKLKTYVESSSTFFQKRLASRLIDAEKKFDQTRRRLEAERVDRFDERLMQLHRENAELVAGSMEEHGWLDAELVGHEGAEAAFLLVANAYTQGPLNHRVIESMQSSVDAGVSPLRSLAMLQDRARFLRSLPVIYGTVGDFDADGRLTVGNDVVDPAKLNQRRAVAGFDAVEETRQRIIDTYGDRDDLLRPDPQRYEEERRELASVGSW
ncbi:MAG: DUF6624 domain-containing protein [Pseudomonadota bacterium]